MTSDITMGLMVTGEAQRGDLVRPVLTFAPDASLAEGYDPALLFGRLHELQSTGRAIYGWMPPFSELARLALWATIRLGQAAPVFETLNPAIAGLGLFENTWAVLYDHETALTVMLGNIDQATPTRKGRDKPKLTPCAVVIKRALADIIEHHNKAADPWFVTFFETPYGYDQYEAAARQKAQP